MVPTSAKGKGTKQRRYSAVPLGPDTIERLKRLTIGRGGHEPLLMRWISRQIGPVEWERVKRAPWSNASEMTRGWKKALAAAGVPHVEPYALRHSSIVRGLRSGVPVRDRRRVARHQHRDDREALLGASFWTPPTNWRAVRSCLSCLQPPSPLSVVA